MAYNVQHRTGNICPPENLQHTIDSIPNCNKKRDDFGNGSAAKSMSKDSRHDLGSTDAGVA
jgi:hypothetical protein